jgi:uncharacterized repeat protein (TIGR03803 family)
MSGSGFCRRTVHVIEAAAVLLLIAIVPVLPSQAQTYTVLHKFHYWDGASPTAPLIMDAKGNLYGTTASGGGSHGNGDGTVFRLDTANNIKVVYRFSGGADGRMPLAGLVPDAAGNLYGTTEEGGDTGACNPGCGVVFKIDGAGRETVLYTFTNGSDGAYPGGLVRDQAGNLYGTTLEGGTFSSACRWGCGVVFKIDSSGNYSVLYSFSGGTDGAMPRARLLLDRAANLYGTTLSGGLACPNSAGGCGVVFTIDSTGNYTVLYTFLGGDQGAFPSSALVQDPEGSLYGTTDSGGNSNCDPTEFPGGCGIVFKLDTAGNLTVLHAFSGEPGDGAVPTGVLRDKAGNLYGTTTYGGAGRCVAPPGCGTVFKLDTAGNETVLYSFKPPRQLDGRHPEAPLIMDKLGTLYGTTANGEPASEGIVFKLTP